MGLIETCNWTAWRGCFVRPSEITGREARGCQKLLVSAEDKEGGEEGFPVSLGTHYQICLIVKVSNTRGLFLARKNTLSFSY